MLTYKNTLLSLSTIFILSGCDSTSNYPNSNNRLALEAIEIEKDNTVSESEDSLVDKLFVLTKVENVNDFIIKSLQIIVTELVKAYVPESYVDDILSMDALQIETLQANQRIRGELEEFYSMANDTNKRALNTSLFYEIMASISDEVYAIIRAYFFGESETEEV